MGKLIGAACEDLPRAPSSSLLADLNKMAFFFRPSYSVIDEDFEEGMFSPTLGPAPLFPEMEDVPEASDLLQVAEHHVHGFHAEAPSAAGLPDLEDLGKPADISQLTHEETLSESHLTSENLLESSKTLRVKNLLLDVDSNPVNR